jgi:hypothetical protein
MTDEVKESVWRRTDWKALLAAASLFCGALVWVGTLYRNHILSLVDQRIAAHAEAAAGNRASLFRELESKAGGAFNRIGELERHCAEIRGWRPSVDAEIEALQTWRSNCSVKVAGMERRAEADDASVARIDRELSALRERVFDALNPKKR